MQSDHTLELALRALVALIVREQPDPADVDWLRTSAEPDVAHLDLDESACHIIRRAIASRSRDRPRQENE